MHEPPMKNSRSDSFRIFLWLMVPACLFSLHCSRDRTSQSVPEAVAYAPVQKLPDAQWNPGWSKENVLVYQVTAEPPTLHPTNGNSSPWQEAIQYLHAFLVNINFRNPGLEEGILSMPVVSADGLHYTYHLRNDARWDDGSSVTIDDIVFTLKASSCPLTNNPHAKSYWDNLQDVMTDASDMLKITLVMKTSYIQNTGLLAEVPVLQRTFFDPKNILGKYPLKEFHNPAFDAGRHADLVEWAREFNDEKYGRDPLFIQGLGPYRLTKWEPGQSLVFEKKKNYWYKGPDQVHLNAYPDKIIFKLNRDDVSQQLEFKAQTLDASGTVSIKTLVDLKNDTAFAANYHAAVMPTYNYTYIAMNERPDGLIRQKLFDDVRVRQALALLTPVDEMIRIVYKDYSSQCRRLAGPVSPLKTECDTTLSVVMYDHKKAQQLLEEAGWKDSDNDQVRDQMIDGKRVSLSADFHIMNTSADWKDMAALVVASCRKAGIRLNVISLDPKVFVQKAHAHDFDLMLGVWGGTSHAEDYSQLWHTSSWLNNGNNYPGYGNASSDALIDSIRYTLDMTQRIAMVKRLQRLIDQDRPMVFLYSSLRRNIIHKRFTHAELYSERPGFLLNNLQLGTRLHDDVNP